VRPLPERTGRRVPAFTWPTRRSPSPGWFYKLLNRMSSGTYFPGSVRAVGIPKDHGPVVRLLGVPNEADRVAPTAAAMLLEDNWSRSSILTAMAMGLGDLLRTMPDGTLSPLKKGTRKVPRSRRPSQAVHALCVRPLDGPEAPGLSIRALRGQRGDPL